MLYKFVTFIFGLLILGGCAGEPAPTKTPFPDVVDVIYEVRGAGKVIISFRDDRGIDTTSSFNIKPGGTWRKTLEWDHGMNEFPFLSATFAEATDTGKIECRVIIYTQDNERLADEDLWGAGKGASRGGSCGLNPWRID